MKHLRCAFCDQLIELDEHGNMIEHIYHWKNERCWGSGWDCGFTEESEKNSASITTHQSGNI